MPASACLEPMCPEFGVTRGRCERHATHYNRELKRRTKGADVYKTKRWQVLRRSVLRRDRYTCQSCLKWANEVDHVVPINAGGAVWDASNLQALCKPCHSSKTAKEVWS